MSTSRTEPSFACLTAFPTGACGRYTDKTLSVPDAGSRGPTAVQHCQYCRFLLFPILGTEKKQKQGRGKNTCQLMSVVCLRVSPSQKHLSFVEQVREAPSALLRHRPDMCRFGACNHLLCATDWVHVRCCFDSLPLRIMQTAS